MRNENDVTIRPLTIKDAIPFADHMSRHLTRSGTGTTPIFWVRSRKTPINPEICIKKVTLDWSLPLETHGWERAWGVCEGGKIFGSVALATGRYVDTQPHRVMLGMGLEESHRKMGLGAALLNAALLWAAEQSKLKYVDLGVFAHNHDARRLYEKSGFVECGRTIDAFFIDDQYVDDIQMFFDLNQLR